MTCIHRRGKNATIQPSGLTIWNCEKRQLCTETDHGRKLLDGSPMAVCESCPLYSSKSNKPGPGEKRLTVGLAYYRDWPGLWATVKSLQLAHPEVWPLLEIVVVDNDPTGDPNGGESSHSAKARRLCNAIGGKYEHYTAVAGTAAAKGRIFDLATTPSVLVMDCHVLLPTGVLAHLVKCLEDHPDSKDLWQGPCIGDGGIDDVLGTHFEPRWGSLMYGQWSVNRQSLASGEPFEIEMQGCGLFCCHRHAWPGFHPLLKGFGPEEFHLHQRIRRNGGKCWSLPWLKWCHRFGNPDGTRPPGLHPEERLRGHLITHLDTRAPSLTEIRKHFVDDAKVMDNEAFFRVLRDTVAEFWADRQDLGQTCLHRQPFLRVADCEIGCIALRAPLPVFSCGKHGECAPWSWQQSPTMPACLTCPDRPQ